MPEHKPNNTATLPRRSAAICRFLRRAEQVWRTRLQSNPRSSSAQWQPPENEQYAERLYRSGERVPPGIYKMVGSPRRVRFWNADWLPTRANGQPASYRRL